MKVEWGKFFHEKTLGLAIFFGRVEWADNEARALGYTPQQRRGVLLETHRIAAARSRIIHGDWEREDYHLEECGKLFDDKDAVSLTEYTQPNLL